MKNSMLVKSIMIFVFVSGLALSGSTKTYETPKTITMNSEFGDLTYSWTADPNAVSYIVDVKNTSTEEEYSGETTATAITFFGLPSGTYEITVRAKYADESTSIVIEDLVVI